jgi:hypothetical protein
MVWIDLAEDWDRWRVLVNAVMVDYVSVKEHAHLYVNLDNECAEQVGEGSGALNCIR